MTVGEMLGRMDARELSEWVAYELVAGRFGPERLDLLVGILASVVATSAQGRKGRRYKPADFMPDWSAAAQEARPLDAEEMLARVKSMHKAMGGDLPRKGGTGEHTARPGHSVEYRRPVGRQRNRKDRGQAQEIMEGT